MPQPAPMPATSPEPISYDTLEVHSERPGFCVAHAGPLVVPIWTQTASADQVDLIGEAQKHVLLAYPKCAVLTIIRAELSMSVDDDVRDRGKANIKEFGDTTLRSVLVVESTGLRASFFRSVITSVYFLTRSSSSQKVSSSIDDGLDWLFEPLQAGEGGGAPIDAARAAAMRADVHRFADDFTRRQPPKA